MALALFDLDNTLIGGDSDHTWGRFICRHGLVDKNEYRVRNDEFFRHYQAGTLDIAAYQEFSQALLSRTDHTQLLQWHQRFMTECIEPLLLPKAQALLDEHRARGDTLMIITATNRFITEPIARRLGVELILATECERIDGRYTGRMIGIPCFQGGKVQRLQEWLAHSGESLEGSYFYSDSINDLPLLETVTYPTAVDPDPRLKAVAETRGWPILSLR